MKNLFKKILSNLLVLSIYLTFVCQNVAFASETYSIQEKNVIKTYEGMYVTSQLMKDYRYQEQNNNFYSEGISLKNNIKAVLKYPDKSYKIVYVVEKGEKIYELIYYMDSSYNVLLQDKKENTLLANDSMNIKWTMDNDEFLDVTINKNGTLEYKGKLYSNEKEFVKEFLNGKVQNRGACEFVMSLLCGAGGGAGCYGICAIEAVVTRIGALGCAVACGLIASVGCYAATERICG